ncbi:histone deacetylase [Rhinocladiella similis]
MDPDIAAPSIEEDSLPHRDNKHARPPFASPAIKVNHHSPIHQHAAAVPLPPSSPMRTPYRSPSSSSSNLKTKSSSPRTPSRSPSVASSYRDDRRQSTPVLASKRSTSSLSTARGTTPGFRRTSSNLNPASPVSYGKMTVPQERPQLTPSSVAQEYFGKELESHASLQSPLAVIVHDACYGHRFSRPRATKNALATIVERPERIHATLLGASTAYVRLGGRHAEGQHPPQPKHNPQRVRDIPFQIRKTSRNMPLTHPSVAFVHGTKWMEELQIMCDAAEGKLAMNGKELVRPIGYGKDENGSPLPKLHEGDLYLCKESLAAFQGCLGGVCDAVDTVFSSDATRRAFVCIRPPGHHCSSNFPSGFCWLNNVHVGIAYAAMTHGLTHAAIIDFDLHHGDGSQNIAWTQNRKAHTAPKNAAPHKKTPIGYYSLHDINSYPCEWGDEEKVQKASLCIENAHGQSIWNVHLEPWKSLEEFWQLYETKYTILLDKARIFLRHHTARIRATGHQSPKAAIFISAGFDASEWEGAGMQRHSVNVPTEFYARFTADIVKLAHEGDLGVDGRVISVLEGGYSDRALTSGVLSHICGFSGNPEGANGHGPSISRDNKFQTINNWIAESVSNSYLPDWWALQTLEELEAVVAGRQPPTAKPLKEKTGNYSSPTQASTLKMTDHARERHSLSAHQARLGVESEYTPPPPDVDWAVASYELSRIVVPGDRQTHSCTHEELNAEAARARRERQSTVGVSAGPDERMQLRDRKAKLPPPPPIPSTRVASRNGNRRTTIAAISDLPDPTVQGAESGMSRPRRRSSDASSILSSFQNMKLSEADGPDTRAPSDHVTTSRAASVVNERSTKAVAVKKPRASATTKTTAKPKTSPRKPKAMPPPNGVSNSGVLPTKPSVIDENKAFDGGEKRDFSNPSRSGSADELDTLANGVKKISIKLNLSTAEKNAAKEQQQAADDKQKRPRAPRKPAVPKPTKMTKPNSSAAPENSAPVEAQTVKMEDKITNQPMPPPSAFPEQASQSFALPSESPVEPKPSHSLSNPPPSQAFSSWPQSNNLPNMQQTFAPANVPQREESMVPGQAMAVPVGPVQQISNAPQPFDHFQVAPEQPPAPVYQIMQTGAAANPPRPTSAGLSTPRYTKQDLPVFTSSSPIPFAAPPNARVDDTTMQEPKDG